MFYLDEEKDINRWWDYEDVDFKPHERADDYDFSDRDLLPYSFELTYLKFVPITFISLT